MSGRDTDEDFENELRSLLAAGEKIEAIKRIRERTGVGLAAAKEFIEALERGAVPRSAREPAPAGSLDNELVALLERGQKIEAIRLYRERNRVGLKEAKDAVERIAAERGIATSGGAGCFGVILAIGLIVGVATVLAGNLIGAVP